jgi:hypothetical protein
LSRLPNWQLAQSAQVKAGNGCFGAKPEAANLLDELLLSAVSGPSEQADLTAAFDPQADINPRVES